MNKTLIIVGVIVLILVIVFWSNIKNIISSNASSTGTASTDLATCLKNSGAKFYGASYCTHCENEKSRFGNSAVNLPYIQCDGSGSQECANAKITAYPTWIFGNGQRQEGDFPLETLKQFSGC